MRKELTFEASLEAPERNHVITDQEADKLVSYFNNLDEIKEWTPDWFAGKTILDAGTEMDCGAGYPDECIHHIICELFDYDGIY